MRSLNRIVVIATFLFFVSQCCGQTVFTSGAWNGSMVEFAVGRAIITMKSDSSFALVSPLVSQYSVSSVREFPRIKMRFLEFPDTVSVLDVCATFNADTNVKHCCPDFRLYPADPNDTYWPWQWGFKNTGQLGGNPGADMMASEAWSLEAGEFPAVIGLLDTGLPPFLVPDVKSHFSGFLLPS